jgi:hypothetical protein
MERGVSTDRFRFVRFLCYWGVDNILWQAHTYWPDEGVAGLTPRMVQLWIVWAPIDAWLFLGPVLLVISPIFIWISNRYAENRPKRALAVWLLGATVATISVAGKGEFPHGLPEHCARQLISFALLDLLWPRHKGVASPSRTVKPE